MSDADWPGLTIADGRYKILRKLAEGGMAFAYVAVDAKLGSQVVIKAARSDVMKGSEFAARFTRELRSLVLLSHPNIVKVFDVGEHQGTPFIVLQYIRGGSLRDRQPRDAAGKAKPMPPESLHAWLPSLAAALDYIHQRGYVHRDVKPDNLLFDEHGNIHLSDFGIAKVINDQRPAAERTVMTQMGKTIGTPHYMAPELILTTTFDQRVDQYALAVTVYELLSGRRPFEGETSMAIFMQQVQDKAPSLNEFVAGLPEKLTQAIDRGLAKNPDERFADCTAFVREALAAIPRRDSAPATVVLAARESRIRTDVASGQASTPALAKTVVEPLPDAEAVGPGAVAPTVIVGNHKNVRKPDSESNARLKWILGSVAALAVGVALAIVLFPNAAKTSVAVPSPDIIGMPAESMTSTDNLSVTVPPVTAKKTSVWGHLDTTNAKIVDDFVRINRGSYLKTKITYASPIEIAAVVRTENNNIRIRSFKGACVIFNWERDRKQLRVTRPDGNDKAESGSLATKSVQPLTRHKWYNLRWRITNEGMDVSVDGVSVFSEKRKYNLSSSEGPAWIAAAESVVDVKSFDVTPILP